MFHPDVLWRHKDNKTVAFEVLKRFFIKEKKTWSLKVAWYVISPLREPCPMIISQRIRIPMEHSKEWIAMDMNCRGPASQHKEW